MPLVCLAEEKPNVLFICIDDLRAEIGAYGKDYMVTPNLDKLASEGRLFNQHFVQIPVSGPSRECLLTGLMARKTSEIYHEHYAEELAGSTESENPESFVHHLKRNGYTTIGVGKISHHADGHFKNALELPYSWTNYVSDPNCPWKASNLLKTYASGRDMVDGNKNLAYEAADVSDDDYVDGMSLNLALNELEKLSKNNDKPFFLSVGFVSPHLPFCSPVKYWDKYDRNSLNISTNPDKPLNVADEFIYPSVEFNAFYTHPERAGVGVRLPDDYAQLLHHAYYSAASYTDALVGQLLDKLEELELDKNTIVIVWGDHGWMLGEKTIWGKQNVFDKALNSVFIVKTPGMNKAGVSSSSLVATIDIYPTLCELTGIEAPKELDGVSFVPILENPKAKTRESVVSHWRNILSLRTERYRFSIYKDGDKEPKLMLFDHKKDPDEINNLAVEDTKLVQEFMDKVRAVNNGFFNSL